jgi:predicted regulator of Ras-like GTPase activity (Roadblock/LC7/MglB family)
MFGEVKGDKAEALQEILKALEAEVPEIEASSVVSAEGLPIASALPRNVDEIRVAAMTAALLNMGDRASLELDKGVLNHIILRGDKGYLISMAAGENAVITVSATKDARLGFLLLFIERTAKRIQEVLT